MSTAAIVVITVVATIVVELLIVVCIWALARVMSPPGLGLTDR